MLGYSGGDQKFLRRFIARKESKIDNYRRNSGVNRQWLLLVTGVVGAQEPIPGDLIGPMFVRSRFERIFLMDVARDLVLTIGGSNE
jgi:hypothetical protein